MTTAALIKQVKSAPRVNGQLYCLLMAHVPPTIITSKKMHDFYSSIVATLVSMLVEGSIPSSQEAAIRLYVKATAHFVDEYEKVKFPSEKSDPVELLKFLMEQHNLTQDDLANDLGGQSVVSAVLNGKRSFNIDQVKKLSVRFGVSPAVFIS